MRAKRRVSGGMIGCDEMNEMREDMAIHIPRILHSWLCVAPSVTADRELHRG